MPRATRKPSAAKGPVQPRRVSRREREAKQRQRLYIGLGVAGALVVGILLFSSLNEYVFKPRAVVASVNGVDIRRRDYWKVRSVDLINQINQDQQFAQLVDASQQQQYVTLAQQAADDLDNVWGSTDLDETTLNRMVEDQVYLQNMDTLGLAVTDADVETYIDTQFQPQDAPITTQTPTPTLIPQRAEWATQTIEAESQEIDGTFTPTPVGGTPEVDPFDELATAQATLDASPVASSVVSAASPIASPMMPIAMVAMDEAIPNLDVVVDEASSGDASPVLGSPAASPAIDPAASPVASPILPEATDASATPNPQQALETAEANYEAYQDGVFGQAHLSTGDYERLIVRPAVAREKVRQELTKDIGQTAEQVHAAHILVDTKDLADTIYQSLQEPGANFEQTAIDQSNDTSTAPNGGDLGWFARGQMVDPFEQAAFSLAPGTISEPVQSEFGWHIIKVYEKEADRALTDQQIEQYRENVVNDWLAQQRATMDVSSDIKPSPTPGVSNFVPPADAPPPPTETPELEATPVTEPSPIAEVGTPVAVASPATGSASPSTESTPIAGASPVVESVLATPLASPIVLASPPVAPTVVASPVAPTIVAASPVGVASPKAAVASPVLATPLAQSSVIPATPLVVATPAETSAMPVAVDVGSPSPMAFGTLAVSATPSPSLAGTPIASPVSSIIPPPMASPVVSRIASPVASPVASPIASPAT